MKNYDLNLPLWGPYNKKYLGAAHIADARRGYRFDVNLFPGYYRRSVMTPLDVADCGAKMMAASADLSHFVYRYELEWKDRVYIDADFCSAGNAMTVTCDFVNETDNPESLTLNAVMSLQRSSWYRRELVALQPVTGKDTCWLDALDYAAIETAQPLAMDGLLLGEKRASGFAGGSCISGWTRLEYAFEPRFLQKLGIRCCGKGSLTLQAGGRDYKIAVDANMPQLCWIDLPAQRLAEFAVLSPGTIDLDGFSFGEEITFDNGDAHLEPSFDGKKLTFGDLEYRIECDFPQCMIRTLRTGDVGQLLSSCIHNHVSTAIGKEGHPYIDLFLRPVFVAPRSRERIVLRITAPGQAAESDPQLYTPCCNSSGEKYTLSQQIMAAVTLTNVVWPIYCRRGFIRHNTPGRNWDSLYTWDSGFIGMGLAELSTARAEDCLNAYLTPVGDPHSPYIMHGSPVPTQIFLFAELFNKTGSVELLKKYYPMVQQQYRFFAKRQGIFSTWDLFYNSGGWDDYPTQQYVHTQQLEATARPMVNVSITVLCAKILRGLAVLLGEETQEYDADIARYTEAVNAAAWDEESGYYGYLNGDRILKINGVNADMGLDGAYPYIAGISDKARSARIIHNIKEGMLTPIGVSVVDTRAPYYRTDGYWNGSVWMPHQWILWKALLDHGEADLALQIASTALEVWQKEVGLTYNCYEHFMIANGRGAGFHQFSGLSTPVLMWFNALYKPYTVTAGFLATVTERSEQNGLRFKLRAEGKAPIVIVTLEESKTYEFCTTGQVACIHPGTYLISFQGPIEEQIEIKEKE